jgi:hypothetical protein
MTTALKPPSRLGTPPEAAHTPAHHAARGPGPLHLGSHPVAPRLDLSLAVPRQAVRTRPRHHLGQGVDPLRFADLVRRHPWLT